MPAGPMTLVVMSHGSGGSFLGHHDTARALAEAGFVVAALNHTGDNALDRSRQGYLSIFSTRPREIRRLIDYMTGAWPGRAQLRSDAVGFFGFSRGGYTGMVLAGAAPDFSQGLSFCESQPGLPMSRHRGRQGAGPALPEGCPRQGPGDRRSAQCVRAVGLGRRGRVCPAVGVRAGR